jgi:3',5'-cyclic AMP phosphodiesterase CpdA
MPPSLLAVSDLHVHHPENRALVQDLTGRAPDDWLIVAGDVAARDADLEWALTTLRQRFGALIWVPGNHELWSGPDDPVRGEQRYRHLVDLCRSVGAVTPEDPYPVWEGPAGPAAVVPMFVLYDYTFRPPGATSQADALARARAAGVVCADERLLHPDPYPSREAWCQQRLTVTRQRLAELPAGLPTVLVNHFPLVREPTKALRYPEFAQWCGTVHTAGWPQAYQAAAVVYGHLHIPRTTWHDGIRHEEVSLGYPREWRRRPAPPAIPRRILPAPG